MVSGDGCLGVYAVAALGRRAVVPGMTVGRLARRASQSSQRQVNRDLPCYRGRGHVIRFTPTVSRVAAHSKKSESGEDDAADVSDSAETEDTDDTTSKADKETNEEGGKGDDKKKVKKSKPADKKKDAADADVTDTALSSAEDDVAPALEGDWRDFRAKLVSIESGVTDSVDETEKVEEASGPNLELLKTQNPKLAAEKPWAHTISAPERGCLLIARGDSFSAGQQYFHQAVILLLEHNERGTMGVILNRPTQYTMGYVSGDTSGPFAKNALYFGGDVGDGTVSFLHGSGAVSGSVEVTPGVYLGGYDSACNLAKGGEIKTEECKFFARYCGWGAGQLQGECERNVWYPVAAAKSVVLKQVLQLPKPLWREVSELVGDKVGYESRKAYGEETEEDVEKFGFKGWDPEDGVEDE